MQQEKGEGINFDLAVSEVDDSFLLQPNIAFDEQVVQKLVRKSYIFYVIELRTGVTPQILKNITSHILESCFELIEQGLAGISFVINGVHHPLKNITVLHVKELLSSLMVISQNDDYCQTLEKTRHAVQSVAQKLNETKVTLLFFFSYVHIDHSLGTKKRSYIDYLNQHSEKCSDEVIRLSKTIRNYTDQCKCFIISLDKNGQEQEDYSQADTQLMNQISMLVGNHGSILYRNYSNNQLTQSFRSVTALLLTETYSLSVIIPAFPDHENPKDFRKYYLTWGNFRQLNISREVFIHKTILDLNKTMQGGSYIHDAKLMEQKIGVIECKGKAIFRELKPEQLIVARAQLYNQQLDRISWKLSQQIVSYKRRYELGKSFLVMNINQPLLLSLRDKIDSIYEISKVLYTEIFTSSNANKAKLFESYNQLKAKIDVIQEILLGVFKKRIGGSQIGKLSQLISLTSIKRALKVKLIRRINANPYLLDQVYRAVEDVVDGNTINFIDLQMNSQQLRYDLGNCILSNSNFVRAMQEYDAMGVAFQLQRPESAIADPGRIRIRQVSPHLMRTSQFFQKFIYKVNYTPQVVNITLGRCLFCGKYNCYLIKHNLPNLRAIDNTEVIKYKTEIMKVDNVEWNKDVSQNTFGQKLSHQERIASEASFQLREVDYLRDKGELFKSNYTQRCDYSDKVNRTSTVLGFMPLYLTKEHWMVARHLMKPSLAWTATGQPLGYLFSQFQTIPFIVLANLIRTVQEKQYQLQGEYKLVNNCKNEQQLNVLETKINLMKQRVLRMKNILNATQQTCKNILIQLSTEKYDPKLLESLLKQYTQYRQPINRTVDVISNNSAFIAQLYAAFKNQLLNKPNQQEFHEFFIRLIEQQLRRETDGWNEEETQDLFIDKLLNVQTRDISQWTFSVVGGEQYRQKFEAALQGQHAKRSFVELQKQQLQMMLRKQGKFNECQRMLMIEYKRLYENRVLWLWYVRFLIYGPWQRVKIHKWKCLDLKNSYMLFTLIIQNKKQRKNYKRRQAILNNQYADPFDYVQARQFLQQLFVDLRAKKESEVLKKHNLQVCVRAAEIFCMSGNLDEAAGTLVNFDQNGLLSYYHQLARGNCVRVQDKLRMLLTGEHRGVKLFSGWKMKFGRWSRLQNKYPFQFEKYKYMI